MYCKKGVKNHYDCKDENFPCLYNETCLNYSGNTLQQHLQNRYDLLNKSIDVLTNKKVKLSYYSDIDQDIVGEILSKMDCVSRGRFCQVNKHNNTMCKDEYIYNTFIKECKYGYRYFREGQAKLHSFGYEFDAKKNKYLQKIFTSEKIYEDAKWLDTLDDFNMIVGEDFSDALSEKGINLGTGNSLFSSGIEVFYEEVKELEADLKEFEKRVLLFVDKNSMLQELFNNIDRDSLEDEFLSSKLRPDYDKLLIDMDGDMGAELKYLNEEVIRIMDKYKLVLYNIDEDNILDFTYEKFIFFYASFPMEFTLENVHNMINEYLHSFFSIFADNSSYIVNDLYDSYVLKQIQSNSDYKVGDIVLQISHDDARPEKGIRVIGYNTNKDLGNLNRRVIDKLRENNVQYDDVNYELNEELSSDGDFFIWTPDVCQRIMGRNPINPNQ